MIPVRIRITTWPQVFSNSPTCGQSVSRPPATALVAGGKSNHITEVTHARFITESQ